MSPETRNALLGHIARHVSRAARLKKMAMENHQSLDLAREELQIAEEILEMMQREDETREIV